MQSFSQDQLQILRYLCIISSILSIIGSGANVVRILRIETIKWRFRHRLIMYLSLSDLTLAVAEASYSLVTLGKPSENDLAKWICDLNGFLVQTSLIFTDCLIFSICVHSALIVLSPRKNFNQNDPNMGLECYERYVVGAICLLSFGTSTTVLLYDGYTDVGAWCWISEEHVIFRILFSYGPRLIIIICLMILYGAMAITVYVYLMPARTRVSSNKTVDLTPDLEGMDKLSTMEVPLSPISPSQITSPTATFIDSESTGSDRKISDYKISVLRKLALYPLAYLALWIAPTVNRSLDEVRMLTGTSPIGSFGWASAQAFLSPLHGFVDAIVYGLVET